MVTRLNIMAQRRENWLFLPMAIYGSVFLMLIMRGSLMIALAYLIAAFLAFGAAYGLLSIRLGARQVARRALAQAAPVS